MIKKLILLGSFFLLSCTLFAQQKESVVIHVSDIRRDKGVIRLALFDKPEGFPSETEKAVRILYGDIKEGKAKIVIENLAPGTYSFALLHDENKNGKSDTNWIGMPKEGIAVSNNAKGSFGPPKYRDATFQLGKTGVEQTIKMIYL